MRRKIYLPGLPVCHHGPSDLCHYAFPGYLHCSSTQTNIQPRLLQLCHQEQVSGYLLDGGSGWIVMLVWCRSVQSCEDSPFSKKFAEAAGHKHQECKVVRGSGQVSYSQQTC